MEGCDKEPRSGGSKDFSDHLDLVEEFCKDIERRKVPKSKSNTSKRIGTYFEKESRKFIERKLGISGGSVGKGVDVPAFNLDVRSTSIAQPQSSSPFSSLMEMAVGVSYNILLFIYDKKEEEDHNRFEIVTSAYIPKEYTGDHRVSKEVSRLVRKNLKGEITDEELLSGIQNAIKIKGLTVSRENIDLEKLKENPPKPGVVTITGAIQWRFNYNKFKKPPYPKGAKVIYSRSKRSKGNLSNFFE